MILSLSCVLSHLKEIAISQRLTTTLVKEKKEKRFYLMTLSLSLLSHLKEETGLKDAAVFYPTPTVHKQRRVEKRLS